ncbi:hypothetical protein [Fulvivirga sp. M361]|uniref:hypothetical protein n=1 Tax=Fulvivirga sp. M361 TaxID=2594266 RepID=UPI001625086A|nr:hypothetical protein [Fulvivirga sp. M361]
MEAEKELIFVYNADSGAWNGYMDIMHKVFSPKTYACNLCAITYGTFSIKKEWADFIEGLPVALRFLHRDEWEREFKRKDDLPAVFLRRGDQLSVWLEAETMNEMDLEGLKGYIAARVNGAGTEIA